MPAKDHNHNGEHPVDDDWEGDGASRDQYCVSAGELRSFIERWERLDAEKKEITESQKEVMAEARARGYDVKVIRKLIAERKRDSDEVSEEMSILELYREALGM